MRFLSRVLAALAIAVGVAAGAAAVTVSPDDTRTTVVAVGSDNSAWGR